MATETKQNIKSQNYRFFYLKAEPLTFSAIIYCKVWKRRLGLFYLIVPLIIFDYDSSQKEC